MKTNVTVRIMDTDYHLACEIDEKDRLIKGADYLNQHLKAFRRDHPSVASERLMTMGALRVTCELMQELETLSDQAKVANGEMDKLLHEIKK
ncbi:cell division protein ZapA [Ostreibacterium oceani]|uniref:Cell division protein ZapA n=1 Tax=Ostreibacterium oceani TaxID=2654998 RepID=A0A6N7EZB3_9GAMM|nr:cell division protein ZapA [Ostreibacterium oceani]MPV85838.1 cell division protein ZapA [Ostreibacterium oceani]